MKCMEAAFFDLDKTVVSKSSSLALTRPMYKAGLVTRSQLLKGAYAQLVYLLLGADERKMDRIKESMLALTKGWERGQVEQVVREALALLIDPYIYLEALDLMELHRARGRKVFIVSSSPEEVVRPLAERLGEAEVIATRARIEDDRYTGELEFYCYGDNKAEMIRTVAETEGIDITFPGALLGRGHIHVQPHRAPQAFDRPGQRGPAFGPRRAKREISALTSIVGAHGDRRSGDRRAAA